MGCVETVCQLCGVSFAIARIRTAYEPPEAAWDYTGGNFVDHFEHGIDYECGPDAGCTRLEREHEYLHTEHIAGPGCIAHGGYNAYRISVKEMKGCRAVKCLAMKDKYWQPEHDDQDFELESDYFLTGPGERSPDEGPLENIKPVRHGIEEIYLNNIVSDCEIIKAKYADAVIAL